MRLRNLIAICAIGMMASAVMAAPEGPPYYVRGDFNGWDLSAPMVDEGGGLYTYTITGLTPGTDEMMKAASEDWSAGAPGSNARVNVGASGEVNLRFFSNTTWADGWEPSAKARLGWNDSENFDWELIGAMNGWPAATCWFWSSMAAWTSVAVRPRLFKRWGSSQTRMAYLRSPRLLIEAMPGIRINAS